MNALRYNFIFYDKDILTRFLDILKLSSGKNISSVLFAYILHDKDVIEETGELKKQHYHLWLEFPASVRDRDIIRLLELSGSNSSAISKQKTDRNFLAYLTHNTINSTLKKQYDYEDIITNIDKDTFYEWYFDALQKTNKPTRQQQRINETADIIARITDYVVNTYNITSMLDLISAFRDNNEKDLLAFAVKHSYFMNITFKEQFKHNMNYKFRHELDKEEQEELDYEKRCS